ncbi:protein NATD1-like isoform X1 [Protopterus annectens]|uniref:protein NATD1-like isoform X1 n=1 Tax=Protopterus annectens TaxID=7888 RepID=UPI001CF9ACAA|nr:protein NATD1-like isoform X1 [Protopterus annectens]
MDQLSSSSVSSLKVEHDKKKRQFYIMLNANADIQLNRQAHAECLERLRKASGSHDRAVLLYEYVGKRTIDLQHTEVPDAYRGLGIAKLMAKAAMDFAVEEDLKVHITCWYIQKFVKDNPLPSYTERVLN